MSCLPGPENAFSYGIKERHNSFSDHTLDELDTEMDPNAKPPKSPKRSKSPIKRIKQFFKGSSSKVVDKNAADADKTTKYLQGVDTSRYFQQGPPQAHPGGGPGSLGEDPRDDSSDNYDLTRCHRNPIYSSEPSSLHHQVGSQMQYFAVGGRV